MTDAPTLRFRAFLDVADAAAAEGVAALVERTVRRAARVVSREVGPSWWRPELHEVVLELAPTRDVERAFRAARRALGAGWRARGGTDRAMEWTARGTARFVDARVRWASFEVAIAVD
jgi:hypothetical protein